MRDEKRKKFVEKIKRHFEKKYGIVGDVFDFSAEVDATLSFKENIEIIKEKLAQLGYIIRDKNEIKELEKKWNKEMNEFYRKEINERLDNIISNSDANLDRYFQKYYYHIERFLDNKRVKGMVVVGNAGIGKTFNLVKKLREMKKDFVMVSGHITPLEFYKTLYENRNGIIVINDALEIVKEQKNVNILLNALDYDFALVSWISGYIQDMGIPNQFEFNGKIFILLNEFNEKNEVLKAIKDRCLFYEMKFTNWEIVEMMYVYAKLKGYDTKVVDFIRDINENFVVKNLSLRLIDKIHNYDNFEIAKELIELGEEEGLVLELSKSVLEIKEQVKQFIEKTGLSRRTFFRIKKKLKEVGLIC